MTINHTTITRPYALVLRGGGRPGQRPRTKMVLLAKAVYKGGELAAYRGYIEKSTGYTKNLRTVALGDIVARWPAQPTTSDIVRAKSSLPKMPG